MVWAILGTALRAVIGASTYRRSACATVYTQTVQRVFAGCGVFMWALVVAAGRSRRHQISLWNLFLLEGVAPARVRRVVLGALAVEIVVALGTAWITAALAFGCLVPMWGLGHCGLWGARYGTFGPRQPTPTRRQPAGRE